ncbi:hypothetical protein AMTR_s00007p00117320 [Amborella trichopoda]|uniref:Uncharacterized protein n=2 Tax=Amborella trichopoda TaxID=13333 RepID=W1PCC7_AMBTC|nr:hypothetical protein AMTR_s00007p00117320 [Amborella trichopoda]
MSIEDTKLASAANKHDGASLVRNQVCSTNQWPAKVLQQCMKGKHEEAERLLKESKTTLAALNPEHNAVMQGNSTRHSSGEFYARKKREEDANMHLGQENSSA